MLIAGQASIADPADFLVSLKPGRNSDRILTMARHAQRQGFTASHDHEGVEWRQSRAKVAQTEGTRSDRESDIDLCAIRAEWQRAEPFCEGQVIIEALRRRHGRILVGMGFPIKAPAIDDHAANRIAVSANELGQRMDDDMRAMLQRAAEIRRGHRIIDHIDHAMLFRDRSDGRHVSDDATWIGEALGEDDARLFIDRRLDSGEVIDVDKFDIPVELFEGVAELIDRSAIELLRRDDLGAWLHQDVEGNHLRGMA